MTDYRVKSLIIAYKCSSCKRTLFWPYQQICGLPVEDEIPSQLESYDDDDSNIRVPVRGNYKGWQIVKHLNSWAMGTRIVTQTAKNSAETIDIWKTESRAIIEYYNMIFWVYNHN